VYVIDCILDRCYQKTLKERFLVTSRKRAVGSWKSFVKTLFVPDFDTDRVGLADENPPIFNPAHCEQNNFTALLIERTTRFLSMTNWIARVRDGTCSA
jgi:hypothetical protein